MHVCSDYHLRDRSLKFISFSFFNTQYSRYFPRIQRTTILTVLTDHCDMLGIIMLCVKYTVIMLIIIIIVHCDFIFF